MGPGNENTANIIPHGIGRPAGANPSLQLPGDGRAGGVPGRSGQFRPDHAAPGCVPGRVELRLGGQFDDASDRFLSGFIWFLSGE